jgi:hypothetical protein
LALVKKLVVPAGNMLLPLIMLGPNNAAPKESRSNDSQAVNVCGHVSWPTVPLGRDSPLIV